MKKIVFIIGSMQGGGAEKILCKLLQNIDYKKYLLHLLLYNKDGTYLKEIPQYVMLHCIRNVINKKDLIKSVRYWHVFLMERIIKRLLYYFVNPLSIYLNGYDIEILFLHTIINDLAKKKPKHVKRVLWVHSDVTATTYLLNDEKFQKYLPEMDKIICVNEFVKDVFLNKFDYIQSNKIEIINNLIDKNEINKLSEQSVAFQKKHPIILSVGGLRKIKRFDRLIRVHAKLIEKDIDNELIIIGDGEEYCTLSDLITELHVEKTVQLLGYKENPYPYMKMADVFVSSSDFESYSLVILEAIILKVPVVATDTLGSKFLLRQNGIGKVVDFSDEALLNELTKVLITPDYALSIVKSYYKMDLAKFNITKQMKEIESMIDSL